MPRLSAMRHHVENSLQVQHMTRNSLLFGALAGLVATVPMTVAMQLVRRQLPFLQRQRRLPPEQITLAMADTVDLKDKLNDAEKSALVAVGHFGYGAASGAVYGGLVNRGDSSPVLSGAGFGLALWGVSYLGWLPALGIRRSAAEEPSGINVMMIGSHLVWGVATGMAYRALNQKSQLSQQSR